MRATRVGCLAWCVCGLWLHVVSFCLVFVGLGPAHVLAQELKSVRRGPGVVSSRRNLDCLVRRLGEERLNRMALQKNKPHTWEKVSPGGCVLLVSGRKRSRISANGKKKRRHPGQILRAVEEPLKQKKAPGVPRLRPNRLEWGALGGPSFSVDTGLAIGGFFNIARFRRGFLPYFWRLRFTFNFSMRLVPEGIEFPLHAYHVRFDLPGLFGNRLRLEWKIGFNANILQYYGIGNASDGTRIWKAYDPERQRALYIQKLRRYQYRRLSPIARLDARIRLSRNWFLFMGGSLQGQSIEPLRGSKLSEDLHAAQDPGDPQHDALKTLLLGVPPHMLALLQLGVLWDTRDDEITPDSGMLHEVSVRCSPGILLATRYSFCGANATARVYVPLIKKFLVFAGRLVADTLWGQIPFYVLTGAGGLFGSDSFGGGESIRGLRAQRYSGKSKVIANAELRGRFLWWGALRLGGVLFFDVGRVWADYGRFSELDGPGVGLHWGVGAGIRAKWGKALVIRIDVAWSPDSDPVGFYFNLGHVF